MNLAPLLFTVLPSLSLILGLQRLGVAVEIDDRPVKSLALLLDTQDHGLRPTTPVSLAELGMGDRPLGNASVGTSTESTLLPTLGNLSGELLGQQVGQTLAPGQSSPLPPPQDLRPDRPQDQPQPDPIPQTSPPPRPDFQSPPTTPNNLENPKKPDFPGVIDVTGDRVEGSTVFSPDEVDAVTRPFIGSMTFTQLLQARSAVTQLYVDNGYITSGAFLPEQILEGGVVTIQVLEGRLADVQVEGLRRLNPRYVRRRVERAGGTPLNVNTLLEGLQLLQLDPHIANISAELSAGLNPGESILTLSLVQADSFQAQVDFNNGRVPSVGSFRRELTLTENTLLGQGDSLLLRYGNTEGSHAVDVSYSYPWNASNGSLDFLYSHSDSRIIESPFDVLGIRSQGDTWQVSIRQPIIQTPFQEFNTSLSFVQRSTATSLRLQGDRIGFPLSEGANSDGRTYLSVLRFAQDWTQRGAKQVIGVRSQFNLGLDWFGATDNASAPDSQFFSWQGQAQWVRQMAPDTLILVRGNMQLADRPLLSLEQFGLGGFENVRGYRQDQLLTDNGIYGSLEARIPIFRIRQIDSVAQITPFIDVGRGWNSGDRADPTEAGLASVGLGLRWEFANRATAQLDWGIPLLNSNSGNSLQESGLLFSLSTLLF